MKGRLVQRIDPWIRRELQALLGDPDPSIIVHVASSLFIASLEGKLNAAPRQPSVEDDFWAPLRPFLLNQTDMFWHELRYILLCKNHPLQLRLSSLDHLTFIAISVQKYQLNSQLVCFRNTWAA